MAASVAAAAAAAVGRGFGCGGLRCGRCRPPPCRSWPRAVRPRPRSLPYAPKPAPACDRSSCSPTPPSRAAVSFCCAPEYRFAAYLSAPAAAAIATEYSAATTSGGFVFETAIGVMWEYSDRSVNDVTFVSVPLTLLADVVQHDHVARRAHREVRLGGDDQRELRCRVLRVELGLAALDVAEHSLIRGASVRRQRPENVDGVRPELRRRRQVLHRDLDASVAVPIVDVDDRRRRSRRSVSVAARGSTSPDS